MFHTISADLTWANCLDGQRLYESCHVPWPHTFQLLPRDRGCFLLLGHGRRILLPVDYRFYERLRIARLVSRPWKAPGGGRRPLFMQGRIPSPDSLTADLDVQVWNMGLSLSVWALRMFIIRYHGDVTWLGLLVDGGARGGCRGFGA